MGPESRSERFVREKTHLPVRMSVKCNEKHTTEQPSLVIAMKILTARMRVPNDKVFRDVISYW
jgi:hypothetical protein